MFSGNRANPCFLTKHDHSFFLENAAITYFISFQTRDYSCSPSDVLIRHSCLNAQYLALSARLRRRPSKLNWPCGSSEKVRKEKLFFS